MQPIENIDKKLSLTASSLMGLRKKHVWPDEMLLDQAVTQTLHFLDEHLDALHKNAHVLVQSDDKPQNSAVEIEALFHAWHMSSNPPSLLSLCIFILEKMNIKPDADDANMLMVSAILGQVHNEPSYHNDMHFRKVLSQVIRLVVANNEIFEGTSRALNTKQICVLLSAACIHDLGHDGQGNFVKGIHIDGRAEKHSFNLAKPYLIAAGCSEGTLQSILVMLLATDVSPMDDPTNPMMQMKAAYRFHFMGEANKTHALNLSSTIKVLEKDADMTNLCMLLHEADIATSAGVTYDVTKFETSLIMEEFKDGEAYPKDVVNFMDQICQRRFLTDAGVKLFSANMARIYTLAEQDVKSGNEAYPQSKHANFILPKNAASDSTTIN